MNSIVIDCETNGLDPDKIWCICGKILETGEEFSSVDDTGNLFSHYHLIDLFLKSDIVLIGHNIIGYDLPVLKKLLGFNFKGEVIDTLCMSRVLWPDRPNYGNSTHHGGHSLESWSHFFKCEEKIPYENWGVFDPVMVERCKNDVLLCERLYHHLLSEIKFNEIK